jgi:AraC-like DNA-binding protein
MNEGNTADRPCYPLGMVRPFIDLLRPIESLRETLDALESHDVDARIPIEVAHKFLIGAVEHTGDVDLGLKAARKLVMGDLGAVDYLAHSVGTVREAIAVAESYVRLFNEALTVRLEVRGQRALLIFENSIVLPRAAADFQMGGFYHVHVKSWLSQTLANVEVLLTHAEPAVIDEYIVTFAPAQVKFGSPFLGFAFDAQQLQTPLENTDLKLHRVILKQAEHTLTALPSTQTFTQKVRDLAAAEIGAGNATVAHIAKRLGVSPRTLTRKLEREGTTYKDLLEDLRKTLAMRYLESRDLQLSEVALRLGFSQSAAFHRAFRRWTGHTPLQHRRRQLR